MKTNEEYKSFTVSIEFDSVRAKTPLEAAKLMARWLVEDGGGGNAYDMIYDVKDEDTSAEYIVDLSNDEVDPKN
jgi:hypothetical protein